MMKEIILDGRYMFDRETIHKYIREELDFPNFYGDNLDALWDILSSYSEGLRIRLVNDYLIVENLGSYGQDLIDLLYDLGDENNNIKIVRD